MTRGPWRDRWWGGGLGRELASAGSNHPQLGHTFKKNADLNKNWLRLRFCFRLGKSTGYDLNTGQI